MAVTLQNLRDAVYDILREDEDAWAYPLTFVDQLLNSSQQRICNGRVVNPLNGQEVRKGSLPFLNTSQFYSNVAPTTLSAAATVWATSLSVTSCASFPTAGTVYINGNIIAYTGKTSTTTLTGVTGVLFAFSSGSQVSIVFTLPTDFASVISVTYNNKYKILPKTYDDIFEDLNGMKGTAWNVESSAVSPFGSPWRVDPFYTIVDRTYLIIFNQNNTGDQIHLRYEKNPTTMTTSVNVTIDNDIYAKGTIPYIAVWELLYNRWEEGRAADLINFGLGQVREMYNYYNESSHEKISGVQYKTAKSRLNI